MKSFSSASDHELFFRPTSLLGQYNLLVYSYHCDDENPNVDSADKWAFKMICIKNRERLKSLVRSKDRSSGCHHAPVAMCLHERVAGA